MPGVVVRRTYFYSMNNRLKIPDNCIVTRKNILIIQLKKITNCLKIYLTYRCKNMRIQGVEVPKMVKKILMLAVVTSMAIGCAPLHPSGCHKTTATGNCSSGRWNDQDEWGAQARAIRAAINTELVNPKSWKGKSCRLHIEFAMDGTASNISTSNGNKAYCAAVKSAAQKAKFPVFTNAEVYRDFQKSGFDMRG